MVRGEGALDTDLIWGIAPEGVEAGSRVEWEVGAKETGGEPQLSLGGLRSETDFWIVNYRP